MLFLYLVVSAALELVVNEKDINCILDIKKIKYCF